MHNPEHLTDYKDERSFYEELVSRNRHFVSAAVQDRLRNLKILIAGTGSTGGACVEALAREGGGTVLRVVLPLSPSPEANA